MMVSVSWMLDSLVSMLSNLELWLLMEEVGVSHGRSDVLARESSRSFILERVLTILIVAMTAKNTTIIKIARKGQRSPIKFKIASMYNTYFSLQKYYFFRIRKNI